MTSQAGQKIITIYILTNTSKSKFNQAMKFGQSIEYNRKNMFFQKSCKNEAERLVPELSLFFKKALLKIKTSGKHILALIHFGRPRLRHTIKANFITFQTIDSEICSILTFHKSVCE